MRNQEDGYPFEFNLVLKDRVATTAGKTVYVGQAMPGTAETGAGWCIKKMFYDSSGVYLGSEFANSDHTFSLIWSNRASYTYGTVTGAV